MTVPSYDELKELARQSGRSVKQLLALSQNNDPFSVTIPSRREAGEWFAKVVWERFCEDAGVAHLRRLHYRIVAENKFKLLSGTAYENTEECWKYLCRSSLAARYLGLIPFDALVDRRNAEPLLYVGDVGAPSDYDPPSVFISGDDGPEVNEVEPPSMPAPPSLWTHVARPKQKFVVEIWIEKSTMNDVLEPICRLRGVNLIVVTGELSETRCRECVERAIDYGVPVRILYLSDFDPGGRSMPKATARKVEFHIRQFADDYDLDVQVIPLALNQEQVAVYCLPRTPVKDTERRKIRFEETFGAGAVELDALEALHPGELAKLVNEELDNWLDRSLSRRFAAFDCEMNLDSRRLTEEVHNGHAAELAALETRSGRETRPICGQPSPTSCTTRRRTCPMSRCQRRRCLRRPATSSSTTPPAAISNRWTPTTSGERATPRQRQRRKPNEPTDARRRGPYWNHRGQVVAVALRQFARLRQRARREIQAGDPRLPG